MTNTTEINKTEDSEKDVEHRNEIEDFGKNVEQSNKTEDADKDIEQNNKTEYVEQTNNTEDGKKGVQPKVTLDTILANEIGQFGRFQWRSIILAGVLAMLISPANFEYVFSTARIRTRCKIPECDSTEPEWSPYWLPNAIPTTDSRTFDNCHRYTNASAVLRQVESDVCPSAFFDRNTTQPCDEYVYENTHSVAYDFELACDEWKRGLLGTIRTMGTFMALPITGYVSDRWGRRTALLMNALNTCWMGLLRYWANTYLGFMLSEFFEAMCGGAYYSANNILLLEVLGPKYRVAGGAVLHSSASFGQMLMALIAWGVPNWRNLTLAVYTPQLLLISYFWLLSESVRWYMSKGRFDDAYTQLKKIAKINGRQVSDKSLQALRDSVLEEEKIKALNEEREGQEPLLIVQVFRHKRILVRCLITPVWWITYTFVYHGLTINSVNMSGNRYLNYVATAAVDIPGFWTAFFLMSKMGRKPVLIAAFWMCAACQIAYIFLSSDLQAISLIVYLISKFSIAMVKFSIFTYTTELYPTKHRHRLFAYSCMIGRIGSILAPLTPAFGAQWFTELPFALFASIALVSGALVFFTPETHNIKLPDTFEEASQIGRKCEANK